MGLIYNQIATASTTWFAECQWKEKVKKLKMQVLPQGKASLVTLNLTVNVSYWNHLYNRASLVAQLIKNLPAMWETWVQSLGWEDPLEKGKATHASILAWRIPWTL